MIAIYIWVESVVLMLSILISAIGSFIVMFIVTHIGVFISNYILKKKAPNEKGVKSKTHKVS